LAGGCAGTSTEFIVYPLDFARTRLAVDVLLGKHKRQYKGLFDCLMKSVKAEGIRGCYKGYVISSIGMFIYRGSWFGLYDFAKQNGPKSDNFFVRFVVANIVTTAANLLVYPIDTVRRKMQIQTGKKVKDYSSSFNCVLKTFKNDGF